MGKYLKQDGLTAETVKYLQDKDNTIYFSASLCKLVRCATTL